MQADDSFYPITWYRSPVAPEILKNLYKRSDFFGALQTFGFLGLLCLSGGMGLYSSLHWPLGITLLLILLHGMFASCNINAVHELGHNSVFKTKALNVFFEKVFSFFGWMNCEFFDLSHWRHHRYALHEPEDPEIMFPMKVVMHQLLLIGIFNPQRIHWNIFYTWRIAKGKLTEEWENRLAPAGSPERERVVRWARMLLLGHGFIVAFSIYFHLWALPFLTSFSAGVFGSGLHALINLTQHIGLQDNVEDFRLCSRTLTLNPFLQFLFWHMNFHIEHHMYVGVPCYRLGRLHRLIKHDLPPCTHGLIATWKEIGSILALQEKDPAYQHVQIVPQAQLFEHIAV